MRIMRASIFVSVVVVMLIAIYGCAVRGSQGTTADDPVATVTYCELMKDPKRYPDKVVRANALFARDFEVSSLCDPGALHERGNGLCVSVQHVGRL